MQVNFETVDVFTTKRFGGNPLAVFPDARGLQDAQMQQIANEFNLSETTFVLPPRDPGNTASVRIFTPQAEIPFAGHPNVGTAFVLANQTEVFGKRPEGPLTFEEKAGLVALDIIQEGGDPVGARLAAPQDLSVGETVAPDIVAKACNLQVSDVMGVPQIVSAGMDFILARLRSRDALAQAKPRLDIFMDHIPMETAVGIHLYTEDTTGAIDIETRMFAPLFGVPEDPATGSANVALIGYLAHTDTNDNVTLERTISQGVDMGRPSVMQADTIKENGQIKHCRIGGRCVGVMRGTLSL